MFLANITVVTMLLAQAAVPAVRQMGVVKQVTLANREIVVALDNGQEYRAAVPPDAPILCITPGEKSLEKAQRITLSDVSAGDRLLLRGTPDGAIVVISNTDLVRQRDAQRAEWQTRGVFGRVAAIDAPAGELTLQLSVKPNAKTILVTVPVGAVQLRYRPGSAKFKDALPSSMADIKVGDQVQAVGENSADGKSFKAEKIVSGSFRNFAATVNSVDVAGGAISVRDLERNKTVVVQIGPDTALRKITPEASNRLALNSPAAQSTTSDAIDVRSVIEQLPQLELRSLKSGDAVIIASAEQGPHINALTLLSGAEPLLTQSTGAQRDLLGMWNLNLNPGQQ